MGSSTQSLELSAAVAEGLPNGARMLLWIVIGLLLVTLAILIAMAVMMRRRHRLRELALSLANEVEAEVGEVLFDDEATNPGDDMLCPECGELFGADRVRCPDDGRRLLLRSEVEDDGRVCPICSRGFTEAICFCPHDGAALVVADPRRAMRMATAPGVSSGKICPRCRTRHEYRYAFCTKDGSELRILN